MAKPVWKKLCAGSYVLVDGAGCQLGAVRKMRDCHRWFPYIAASDTPDGAAYMRCQSAKAHVLRELRRLEK